MTRRLGKKLFISNSPPIEDSQGSSIDENSGLNLIPFDLLALSVSGKR